MLLVFVLGLAFRLVVLLPVCCPPYTDAAYSYDIALRLVEGQGLSQPFLWNYLDDPASLPRPSHGYWMPLPTLVAAFPMLLAGTRYRIAQLAFAVLSALLPLISYWLGLVVTRRRAYAWVAALLTIFSGFYVPYWTQTDNFAPFAVAGSLALIAGWRAWQSIDKRPPTIAWAVAAGALTGLAHLSRADGPVLLVALLLPGAAILLARPRRPGAAATYTFGLLAGYLAVMLPWFVRDSLVFGTPLPTAGSQTIWLTNYDQLYSYGRPLTLATYLSWGWANILRSKLDALWLNLQTVVSVWGMVFLAPLALVGWWKLRHHRLFQLAAVYAGLLFLAMTLVFTFPGPRGGLFHSGGALLPFVFLAAIVGLDRLIDGIAARRKTWDAGAAKRVFSAGLVGLALVVTTFVLYQRLVVDTRWRQGDATYERVAGWMAANAEPQSVVMVGDPASYWYVSRSPAIVIPNEPLATVLAVADRYTARYLVLDHNRPAPLAGLYAGRQKPPPRLELRDRFEINGGQPVLIFEILPGGE